jgi:mevalonate kinase
MSLHRATGKAFGKVILAGGQFVIQGVPAILSSLPFETICEVTVDPEGKPGWSITDDRQEVPGYKEAKLKDRNRAMDIMVRELGLEEHCLHVRLSGDLLAGSGVGASAAHCVSFVRACTKLFDRRFDQAAVNYYAWRGEFGYHGLPSGVDNTVSTYGGTIVYELHNGRKNFERVRLKKPVEIVMGNSGVTADTSKLKGFLEAQRDEHPDLFNSRLEQVALQVLKIRKALEAGDLGQVGSIMNENHRILIDMGISHPRIIELCELANSLGAFGSKVTGGGRGGYMVALTPGKELQDAVASAFEAQGVSTIMGYIT